MNNEPLHPPSLSPSSTSMRLILEDDVQGVDDTWDETVEDVSTSFYCVEIDSQMGSWQDEMTYPRIVRRMLIRTSAPHPRSRKTPRGGRMIATMIYTSDNYQHLDPHSQSASKNCGFRKVDSRFVPTVEMTRPN